MTTAITTHQAAESLVENTIVASGLVAHQATESLVENTIVAGGVVSQQIIEVLTITPADVWTAQTDDTLLDAYDPGSEVSGIATVTRPESTYDIYLTGDTQNITSIELPDMGLFSSFVSAVVTAMELRAATPGTLDISGASNAEPSAEEKTILQQLEDAGWTINYNGKV